MLCHADDVEINFHARHTQNSQKKQQQREREQHWMKPVKSRLDRIAMKFSYCVFLFLVHKFSFFFSNDLMQ